MVSLRFPVNGWKFLLPLALNACLNKFYYSSAFKIELYICQPNEPLILLCSLHNNDTCYSKC